MKVALDQWGVLTLAQATEAGMSVSAVQRRCSSGAWIRVHSGTYRLRESAPTWQQSLMAACLWAQAAACRRSAARLLELGCEDAPIEVVSPHRARRARGVVVHHTDTLPACDLTRRHGIPVTSASRTLIDLGSAASRFAVERAFEAALRQGLTTPWHVVSRLDQLGACGRNGVGVIRSVLRNRDPRLAPTESELESRLWEILSTSHLPLPVRQCIITDADGLIGRHDFVYLDHRLVVEAQSARWHLTHEKWKSDMDRRNRLVLSGWKLLEIAWQDVIRRPRQVVQRIETALFNVVVEKRRNR